MRAPRPQAAAFGTIAAVGAGVAACGLLQRTPTLQLPARFPVLLAPLLHPRAGPAYPGGGIWVLEPSDRLYGTLMRAISHPRPGTMSDGWNLGDMQVIRYVFGAAP
jgi:hypothetical protein